MSAAIRIYIAIGAAYVYIYQSAESMLACMTGHIMSAAIRIYIAIGPAYVYIYQSAESMLACMTGHI